MTRVAVVGGGSWGTAFADHLARVGHDTVLLLRDADRVAELRERRENTRYLPGVPLSAGLTFDELADGSGAAGADLVVLAVPSRAFAGACALLAPHVGRSALVLSLAKGLDPSSGRRLSLVAAELLDADPARVAILSGPNHAEEVARQTPAATVVACHDVDTMARLQGLVAGPRLRVYANPDVVGVELCGASKNVIAVAAGVSDGLGYGDNAKAALLTRGLAEMTRLGAAFGADQRTFAGLAGLGDLVATCCSRHSRNRRAGELIGQGVPPAELEERIGMVAEGLATAPTLHRVAHAHGLDLPVTERVVAVLEGEAPDLAVHVLMARDPTAEY